MLPIKNIDTGKLKVFGKLFLGRPLSLRVDSMFSFFAVFCPFDLAERTPAFDAVIHLFGGLGVDLTVD